MDRVPSLAWTVPSLLSKTAKRVGSLAHGHACSGSGRACLSGFGTLFFDSRHGLALSGTNMPDIFALNLHIFLSQLAPNHALDPSFP